MTRRKPSSIAIASPVIAAEVVRDTFVSSALGREYPFTVYLPEGYHASVKQRYPVLYLLHGARGDEHQWLERGNVRSVLDKLIGEGKIAPMVVVMPGHSGGWWVDGATEKAETALLKELIPVVERRYNVRSDREGRLFAGSSAGGYAVARYALKYPQLFAAGAALSPAVYVTEPPETSSARVQQQFTDESGKYSRKVWDALNYTHLVDDYERQALRVPLYINSGDRDRHGIAPEAFTLFERVRKIQPDQTELRIVGGDHEWSVWASTIGDAVQYLSRFLKPLAPAARTLAAV